MSVGLLSLSPTGRLVLLQSYMPIIPGITRIDAITRRRFRVGFPFRFSFPSLSSAPARAVRGPFDLNPFLASGPPRATRCLAPTRGRHQKRLLSRCGFWVRTVQTDLEGQAVAEWGIARSSAVKLAWLSSMPSGRAATTQRLRPLAYPPAARWVGRSVPPTSTRGRPTLVLAWPGSRRSRHRRFVHLLLLARASPRSKSSGGRASSAQLSCWLMPSSGRCAARGEA